MISKEKRLLIVIDDFDLSSYCIRTIFAGFFSDHPYIRARYGEGRFRAGVGAGAGVGVGLGGFEC